MLKKTFDYLIVVLSIPLWLPLLIVISILSFFFNGNPIFFIQNRGGLKGKKIKIIKFRTLGLKNKRINSYSNFLRQSKLDELPQILNLLKNEIAIVGPRPLLYEYNKFFKSKHLKRFDVMPGITGWSQINSKPKMRWSKKFQYDVWYVNNQNFFLDIKIIFFTIKKVLISLKNTNKKDIIDKKFNGRN